MNDDATAQQLLKPMPAELFYVLFQQGWRVDQLLRLMVDHIEYRPNPNSDQVQVIRNVASASNKDSYLTFLRISALCYHLQRRGHLIFSADQQFAPISANGVKFTDTKNAPQAKDIADAFAKNLVWQQDPKNPDTWQLGQMVTVPKFKLSPGYVKADKDHPSNIKAYDIEIDMPELAKVRSLDPTLQILDSNGLGFGILENSTPKDASKPADSHGSAQLVMRSLIGMMAAAAQEEDTFDSLMALAKADPAQDPIPSVELQPLLTLKWNRHDEKALTPALLSSWIIWGSRIWLPIQKADDPLKASSWNRDNFRIITQLVSLVTVDISKFPVQQILQLRTQ